MNDDRSLSSDLLSDDLAENCRTLLDQQRETWELLRRNYASLDAVETKTFELDGTTVRVQHNPARMASTTARVDDEAIRARPCFLCVQNLPPEQRAITYGAEFVLLCNPYPIFSEHFTIVHRDHVPQRIRPALPVLLRMGRDLRGEFVVLYNGPRCGASAPDHLHLQAGNSGFLPLQESYERLVTDAGEKVADRGGVLVFAVRVGGRRFLVIESDEIDEAAAACLSVLHALRTVTGIDDEPMVNLLSWFEDGKWKVVIFPRQRHRPSVYFEEEPRRLVVSPAAVDLSGVVIAPRSSDFQRVTKDDLRAIYEEVLLPPNVFDDLAVRVRASIARS